MLELSKPSTVALVPQAVTREVAEHEATGMITPLTEERQQVINEQADEFMQGIMKHTVKSPEFLEYVNGLNSMGKSAMQASTNASMGLLSPSINTMKKEGGTAQNVVANGLADLRSTVDTLTPGNQLSRSRKFFGLIPLGNSARKYFQRYESAQEQINHIIADLESGKEELLLDSASLHVERSSIFNSLQDLNEYFVLAEVIDDRIVQEVAMLKSAGEVQRASFLESDALHPVRQRRQDLATQIAVSVQSYLAMEMIEKTNAELIKGVSRAQTTTVTALRTAVAVAQALNNQRLVLDQIDAVNKTTNDLIANTSSMLLDNVNRTHAQAVNSGVSVETLRQAFTDVFTAIDQIDTFKEQANKAMEITIESLGTELRRTQPYLDRSEQPVLESGANDPNNLIGR